MFRSIICAACLFLAIPLAASARTADHAELWNGAEINWRDSRSGIYEASKTGRPVIMVFHATWCPVCKRFREVFKDPGIVAASRDFVMILVDADAEKELNGAFSSDGSYVPRTLFIDSEGNVSDKLVGSDPQYPHTIEVDKPDELLALMKKARSVFGTAPAEASPPTADRGT
ncbi:MAG TPA: thioredoxin family protein [Hyphomicrobium sp.]|jgi:thiol:disulfide interchange protein|uniref:thioredoxin family protein n=1 Tax=Hyphomicrobium sp. TaxID=82 RepID=UPI002CF1D3E4|nr:thioredoxin family protein [Hyphomicrobium sp.]HXE02394.1 thioredoxin family protein [Hyphomicrobium sp.]